MSFFCIHFLIHIHLLKHVVGSTTIIMRYPKNNGGYFFETQALKAYPYERLQNTEPT
jgi:hypothetical protein